MSIVYEGARWKIERFVSGFSNNAYLITAGADRSSIIIDTPDKPHELITAARQTTVRGVLITHNHWDHLQGFEGVLNAFRVPVGIGEQDAPAIADKTTGGKLDVSDGSIVDAVRDFAFRDRHAGSYRRLHVLSAGRSRRPGRDTARVHRRHFVSGRAWQVEEPCGADAVSGIDYFQAVPAGR